MTELSRRSMLVAIGSSGTFSGIVSAGGDESGSERSTAQSQPVDQGIPYDVKIINHDHGLVEGTYSIAHGKSGKGPAESFELGSRFDAETPDHIQKLQNLPAVGGEYTIEVDVEGRDTEKRSLKISEGNLRKKEAITVSITNDYILIAMTEE